MGIQGPLPFKHTGIPTCVTQATDGQPRPQPMHKGKCRCGGQPRPEPMRKQTHACCRCATYANVCACLRASQIAQANLRAHVLAIQANLRARVLAILGTPGHVRATLFRALGSPKERPVGDVATRRHPSNSLNPSPASPPPDSSPIPLGETTVGAPWGRTYM